MYKTHKTYIKADMKMSDLLNENHSLLMLLEHLEIDFAVEDKTVSQLCQENGINQFAFVAISNLYNGFSLSQEEVYLIDDISTILKLLKNSHRLYKEDKYPEIKEYLTKLHKRHNTKDIELIEKFFNIYFEEVLEHFNYEEQVAFPYFSQLIEPEFANQKSSFSATEYKEHHTDIETKLTDLKT